MPPATAERKRQARIATSTIFFISGWVLSSWVSRIPTITDKLDLSNGVTGIALMSIATGSILAFPNVGRLVAKRGSAPVAIVSTLILLLSLPLIGVAPHVLVLMPLLFCLGIGNGGMEVSMNSQGVEVERFLNRNIMSGLHGFYSLGAFAGAGAGAGFAALDIEPVLHYCIVSALGLIALFAVKSWLIPDEAHQAVEGEPAPSFAIPPRALWVLGMVAFSAAVCEGAIADWSGLYLDDGLGTSAGFAALGFAAFQLAMLIGRFSGDGMVRRFGPVKIARRGGLVAGTGLAIAIAIGMPVPALIGFMAAGIGLAVAFPLAMSAAGNYPGLPSGRSVASVATVGYIGFLAGAPILGWFSELTSLRVMMFAVAALCFMVAIFADATKAATPGHASESGALIPAEIA
ncbi:MFS transporter [soil metagenome]